jgi:protein-disulfide isomerase
MNRFYLVLAAVAVVGLAALGFSAMRSKPVSIPANVTVATADTAGFRGYILGSDSAPVEVTDYADYQCPACGSFEAVQFPDIQSRLIATGRVRWRYRDFPLNQHRHARLAAHAAACANDQGKYWEMHHFLYDGQSDWAEASDRAAADEFRSYAKSAGLDLGKYDACMSSAKYAGRIQASLEEGEKVGVNSTPTLLIAGRLYPGALDYDALRHLVDSLAPAAAPKP